MMILHLRPLLLSKPLTITDIRHDDNQLIPRPFDHILCVKVGKIQRDNIMKWLVNTGK